MNNFESILFISLWLSIEDLFMMMLMNIINFKYKSLPIYYINNK